MIKAAELRIGNLLHWNADHGGAGIVEVVELDKYSEFGFTAEGDARHPHDNDNEEIEGIPLTPEILEACGFEFHSTFEQYQIQRDLYLIVGDRFGHIEKWKVLHEPFNEEWKYSAGDHRHVTIKYLHQLQNIYFALAGCELTIKTLTT